MPLDYSFLNSLGSSDKGEPLQLNATEKVLVEVVSEFAEEARNNLNKADRVSSGHLSDSIVVLDPQVIGKAISIEVEVANYYKFVNKGVKGWSDKSRSGSPYQFKRPSGKSGAQSSAMVTAIRKWVIKEGLKTKDKSKNIRKFPVSERERKRGQSKFQDSSTQTAIIIAANIKRRGLKKTGFWDKAVEKLDKTIEERVGEAMVIDILNTF